MLQDDIVTDFHVEATGTGASPVLVMDSVSGNAAWIADVAADLGPYPAARGNAYPGLRRFIQPTDTHAARYASDLLRRLAPAINATFDVDGFDLLTASFSLVTARPETLAPIQRAPHFDSTDPSYFAILHYVAGTDGSGTAFYRQRSTGIERVTDANRTAFLAVAQAEAARWKGYIGGSNASFERIGSIAAVPDRVIVYQGSLLHSGTIPAAFPFSDDPRRGRLTANFFVRGRPRAMVSD